MFVEVRLKLCFQLRFLLNRQFSSYVLPRVLFPYTIRGQDIHWLLPGATLLHPIARLHPKTEG